MQHIRDFFRDMPRQVDVTLLLLSIAASGFGVLMVYSATRYMETSRYVAVQAIATLIGAVMYFLVSLVDLNTITKKAWKWMCLASLVLILLLLTPYGVADDTGNRAWLDFPFLPVNVQPAEIVKLLFIMVLAWQLNWLKEHWDLKSMRSMVYLAAHVGILFALYYKVSSDMGSDLVILFIFACMCWIAGVSVNWFIAALGGGGIAFYLLWQLDKVPEYMKDRFRVLFDHSYKPAETGWQQTRGILSLGGGKFLGQGLFHGTQTQSPYSSSLPSRHTDFIYCVIGEELGMIGCVLVLVLLTAIIIRCLHVARHAQTETEKLMAIGVSAMLIFQVISNVGMCLFVLPVIGLTLPFFSYGGSSIVMTFVAMGMVSGIHRRSLPEWMR